MMTAARTFCGGLAWCLVCALASTMAGSAFAQYDWSGHLGPRPTGFETVRFGSWDLEILSLRGMVDREFYESDRFVPQSVRSITETTYGVGVDGPSPGPPFRRSVSSVDRDGRIRRIEYKDPLTGKVIQRETFQYDGEGRLTEWSRSRPPSEVAVASITHTLYPGSPPYGMQQQFVYWPDGSLQEWRACTIVAERGLQDCKDDYLRFDSRGRITEFGWSGSVTAIERDATGNAVEITVDGLERDTARSFRMSWKENTLLEMESDQVVGRGFFDDEGRLVQYRVASPETPEYYTTVTWTYDDDGHIATVAKAFDNYRLVRDGAGRVVEVEQTVIPRSVRRKFDAEGRLSRQEPPLFFRRLNASAEGAEVYEYGSDGLVSEITVLNTAGEAVVRTGFDYETRRPSSRARGGAPGR